MKTEETDLQSNKDGTTKYKIPIRPPILKPKITNIGHGNPRYNSMIAYKGNLLLPCGASLRMVNLKTQEVLFSKQIGHSQIFQVEQNDKYILIVNFQGLLTFLDKQTLQTKYNFFAPGKEIRHLSFTNKLLTISCELSELEHKTKFCIYNIADIEKGNEKPVHLIQGHFYYPQQVTQGELIVIEYDDPNPKGRSRTETVLKEKIPVKHRVVRISGINGQLKENSQVDVEEKGQIICAAANQDCIYYLHPGRKMSIFCDSFANTIFTQTLPGKSVPIMIEKFKQGFLWSSASSELTYAKFNKQSKSLKYQPIKINSIGIGANLSIKAFQDNQSFFLYNQEGLHHYCHTEQKTFSHSEFQITNCGLDMNKDASLVAVGDFAGNVSILDTQHSNNLFPKPILKINVMMPIRSLAWCTEQNIIVIGCVGGGLYSWRVGEPDANLIEQMQHTVSMIRYAHGKVFIGTSDGQIKILSQGTLTETYKFKAHHPIQYQTAEEKELFGTMKNFAEIWSLAVSPNFHQEQTMIVSSSQDQTQKVFIVKYLSKQQEMLHHLKGHQLAVTSVDWKHMAKEIGQIYVSCSDDKTVRFRDPNQDFKVLFQLETNTIKEWHTLTYLALEEGGTRVAIGSQNGYLFIFDIETKELVYGEKIHLGGIQGLDWKGGKLCTCSSDLCLSIMEFV